VGSLALAHLSTRLTRESIRPGTYCLTRSLQRKAGPLRLAFVGQGPAAAEFGCTVMKTRTLSQMVAIIGMEVSCKTHNDGQPLVLLHGFIGSGGDWKLVFRNSPKGHQLIVVDPSRAGRVPIFGGLAALFAEVAVGFVGVES
jgi:pimeloyl-ACP methyl ester carboxylesterase